MERKIIKSCMMFHTKRNFHSLSPAEAQAASVALDRCDSLSEKIEFIYATTGPDDLYEIQTRIIDHRVYVYGLDGRSTGFSNGLARFSVRDFVIAKEKEHKLQHLKADFDKELESCEDVKEQQRLVQRKIEEINQKVEFYKSSPVPPDVLWSQGYFLPVRGLRETPTQESAYLIHQLIAIGCAYYDFHRIYLPGLLDKIQTDHESAGPAFNIETQYETVLYFYFSGLYGSLATSLGDNKKAISRIIQQLTKQPATSIRPLLSIITQGYNTKTKDHALYKKEYVENVLNALRDGGFDTKELSAIYEKMSRKEKM